MAKGNVPGNQGEFVRSLYLLITQLLELLVALRDSQVLQSRRPAPS